MKTEHCERWCEDTPVATASAVVYPPKANLLSQRKPFILIIFFIIFWKLDIFYHITFYHILKSFKILIIFQFIIFFQSVKFLSYFYIIYKYDENRFLSYFYVFIIFSKYDKKKQPMVWTESRILRFAQIPPPQKCTKIAIKICPTRDPTIDFFLHHISKIW